MPDTDWELKNCHATPRRKSTPIDLFVEEIAGKYEIEVDTRITNNGPTYIFSSCDVGTWTRIVHDLTGFRDGKAFKHIDNPQNIFSVTEEALSAPHFVNRPVFKEQASVHVSQPVLTM